MLFSGSGNRRIFVERSMCMLVFLQVICKPGNSVFINNGIIIIAQLFWISGRIYSSVPRHCFFRVRRFDSQILAVIATCLSKIEV